MSVYDEGNDVLRAIEMLASKPAGDYLAYDVDALIDAARTLAESVTDEKSLRERLREALRDENALPPTDAASDVLLSVWFAFGRVDGEWDKPGAPSVTDYARRTIQFLERRYLR